MICAASDTNVEAHFFLEIRAQKQNVAGKQASNETQKITC